MIITNDAKFSFFLVSLTLGLVTSLFLVQVYAKDPTVKPIYQVKDGIAVYLGFIPAEMIEGHTANSMHGGIPTGTYRYHIAAAIFNDKTGVRIKGAEIEIKIHNRDGISLKTTKKLEVMEMNGRNLYGNYFALKSSGPYQINVSIKVGNRQKITNFVFFYDFAHT